MHGLSPAYPNLKPAYPNLDSFNKNVNKCLKINLLFTEYYSILNKSLFFLGISDTQMREDILWNIENLVPCFDVSTHASLGYCQSAQYLIIFLSFLNIFNQETRKNYRTWGMVETHIFSSATVVIWCDFLL